MISYCSGYKYQLRKDISFQTDIKGYSAITDLVALSPDGTLVVKKYFAWDGASGPALDDKTNMRASLAHDALYYLMRIGKIPKTCKAKADDLLYVVMVKDGAPKWRASYYKFAVKTFGWMCMKERRIKTAP